MSRRMLLLVLGTVLLLGAVKLLTEKERAAPQSAVALSVTVTTPRHGRIAEHIAATGETVACEEVHVVTELPGVRVLEVFADAGDAVKTGQRLAVVDGKSLEHLLAVSRSDYERALEAFSQVAGVKDTGAVSKQLVLEKRTAMQAARARLDDAELNLRRATILAPADGVIFERKAVIGGLVSASEPLFRIARRDEIELEALVPESALSVLKQGQAASVLLAGSAMPTAGTVRRIAPRVDKATRTAAVRITLHGARRLPVGLFATVRIARTEREGLLLPKTAIQQDGGGDYVWELDPENRARRLPVTVLVFSEDTALVDAIPHGTRVVARAGAFVREGDLVHVAEDD